MPMRFTDLAKATKGATLAVGDGDTICFEFRHQLITPQFMHTLLSLGSAKTVEEQAAAVMAISEQVARVVVEWDLLDEDGETMFPLTVERLTQDIPWSLQIALLQQCIAEMQPGESNAPGVNGSANGQPSGAISSLTEHSERRRTTTR